VEDFEMMDQNISTANRTVWSTMAETADATRLEDVSVMDIYNVNLPKGMNRAVYNTDI
jgi:hypothetical protein